MQIISAFPNLTEAAGVPAIDPNKVVVVHDGIRVGRMPKGTAEGKGTIMLFIPHPDKPPGNWICAELTETNWENVVAVMKGGKEREQLGRQGNG